jgi:hypothetical protein
MDTKRCDNCPNPDCLCTPQGEAPAAVEPKATPTPFEAFCEAYPEALECRIYDL